MEKKIFKVEDITLKADASILISSKRRAGKTVLATNLIQTLT